MLACKKGFQGSVIVQGSVCLQLPAPPEGLGPEWRRQSPPASVPRKAPRHAAQSTTLPHLSFPPHLETTWANAQHCLL